MKPRLRYLTDIAMTAVLLPLMAYSLAGEALHEWLGLAMCVLSLLHHQLNHRWWQGICRGKYSAVRMLTLVLNILLAAVLLMLPISGLILARHLPGIGLLPRRTALTRTVHLLASYWGFVLMGVHLGLHWNSVLRMARKRFGAGNKTVLRIFGALIAVYGAYAFYKRGLGKYLFLKTQFVFIDFWEPLSLFLLDYLAILGLFVWVGHYLSHALKKFRAKVNVCVDTLAQ